MPSSGRQDRPAIPFVGLTGGIGAGKTEALRALAELGAATISTDAVAHELLGDPEVRDLLVARWGPEIAPGGEVDRARVGERVFSDPEELRFLEGVLHPRVGARVTDWRAQVEAMEPPPPLAVVEVPLLFETGLEGIFDAVIAVVVDDEVRERRAAGRGHVGVEGRGARQLSPREKADRADYVVHNDGTLADLRARLEELMGELTAARAPERVE